MHSRTIDTGDEANPLFWILMAGILIGGLVLVSLILSGGSGTRDRAANPLAGGGGGSGAGKSPVLYRGPGITVADPNGGGMPDGPPVTIIQDVRAIMKRLPTDRNHPRGWTNPKVKPR